MGHSLRSEVVRTLAKDVRGDLTGIRAGRANLRIDANSVENTPVLKRMASIAREAMRETGGSQKAFAINCAQSESVVSEAMSGARNLSADWLNEQDDAFVEKFIAIWQRERGLTVENRRVRQLDAVLRAVSELVDLYRAGVA